jgi:hypothetical protein
MILDIGKSGLNTDIAPTKLPPDAVTGGDNFLCSEGSVRAPTMRLKVADLSVEPKFRFVWTTMDNEDKLVVSDGESVLFYDADGTEHDITTDPPFTEGSQVTFCDLGTLLIVNSNEDGPFYYDTVNAELVALPGWDTDWRCEVMTAVRYNLVALNMTEDSDKFPQKVRWSSSAVEGAIPTIWDPTDLAYDAGDEILGESSGHIVGAVRFRDSLWIGKTDSIYEMRYLGGQYVYAISRRSGDLGISKPRAMAAAKNTLVVLSRDDLYRFDGSVAASLTDNRVHDLLVSLSLDGSFSYTEISYTPNQDFLFVTVSGAGTSAEQVLVYSFADDTWSVITFGSTYGFDLCAITEDTDPELIVWRTHDGNWQVESFTDEYDPALEGDYFFVNGYVERTGVNLGGSQVMVEKVLPLLRGADADQPLMISIGVQSSQDAEIRWTPEYPINAARPAFIPVRKVGRYLCWRATARARKPWALDGLDVRLFPAGDKD